MLKRTTLSGEQLNILQDERDEALEDADKAEKRIAELEKELEEERNKPVPVAVAEPDPAEIKKIKDEAAESAKRQPIRN